MTARFYRLFGPFALIGAFLCTPPAHADLVLDQVIVDLESDKPARGDIEISNVGTERMYVLIEPFEILNPGLENEQRVPLDKPSVSKLFVSPQRVILDPDQRSLIRIVAIGERPEVDRIFRVMVRPVVGELQSENDALKVLVGYDALVLLRADRETGGITWDRSKEGILVLRNESNSAREFFEGTQCDERGEQCVTLPAKRLYPGQKFDFILPYSTPVTFQTALGDRVETRIFADQPDSD
ncbi:P pilus assembly protein, chaperone PapD [Altererythrobacter xiamenensis]|uniref:P pilus assembly protein, chaperone PapD n=1 Tax=Altererythrobacter xiamenensis TaxID=1316679 RepID=A0A1Y6F977_9SPHN|nr:hypothetical protein [Altererythrobacter xiamenensis]SMQ69930.1 P pilus assembly protein, chaperone PapD [Altererythrobacter xiamenensis]